MSKIIFFGLVVCLAGNSLLCFDFSMDKKKADEAMQGYLFRTLQDYTPDNKQSLIKKLFENKEKGWIESFTSWFKTTDKSDEDLLQRLDFIRNGLLMNISIYQYLFNAYNQLFNANNALPNVQIDPDIKKQLDAWIDENFLKLLVTDKNDKRSQQRVNEYFNLIANTLISLFPSKKIVVYSTIDEALYGAKPVLPKGPYPWKKEIIIDAIKTSVSDTLQQDMIKSLENPIFFEKYSKRLNTNKALSLIEPLARQWSTLPENNKIDLFKFLKNNYNSSFIGFLLNQIKNIEQIPRFIEQRFREIEANKKKIEKGTIEKQKKDALKRQNKLQKPYIFLSELFDNLYEKKRTNYRQIIEKYVADNTISYGTLLEKITKDPTFFYKEFGTTDATKMMEKWFQEALIIAKKGKKTGKKAIQNYEEVDVREKPNPDLYHFLIKVVEYNPVLYTKSHTIRDIIEQGKVKTTSALSTIDTFADALNSIAHA